MTMSPMLPCSCRFIPLYCVPTIKTCDQGGSIENLCIQKNTSSVAVLVSKEVNKELCSIVTIKKNGLLQHQGAVGINIYLSKCKLSVTSLKWLNWLELEQVVFECLLHKGLYKVIKGLPYSLTHLATYFQDMKRARRMFKLIDCQNLRETSQRMIEESYAPRVAGADTDARRRRRTRPDHQRRRR